MRRLQVASQVDSAKWNDLVRACGGTIFHSAEWATYTRADQPNAIADYYSMVEQDGSVSGVALGFHAKSRRPVASMFTGRRWLDALPAVRDGSASTASAFVALIEEHARSAGDVELRQGSFASPGTESVLDPLGFSLARRFEFELDITRPEKELWEGMDRNRRNKLKKAMKSPAQIREMAGPEGVGELRRLQAASFERITARGGPSLVQSKASADPILVLINAGVGRVVGGFVDDVCVSASFFTTFNGLAYHALSGHNSTALETQAPSLLLWEMFLRMQGEGLERLNFGGCSATAVDEDVSRARRVRVQKGIRRTSTRMRHRRKDAAAHDSENQHGAQRSPAIVSGIGRKVEMLRRQFYDVPWCAPAWGWSEFAVTARALGTASVVQGRSIERFASATRAHLGKQYACRSIVVGTAIELGLRAMGIGSGDDVVIPSYVCRSVLDAVLQARRKSGVSPTLRKRSTCRAGPSRRALTPRTKCVIVVHLFGAPAPIDEIEALLAPRGIAVMDDAAQALGARVGARQVGSFGACGIVSCGPGKPLAGAAGGLLVTDDRELYERAAALQLGPETASLAAARAVRFWVWRRFRKYTALLDLVSERLFGPRPEEVHTNCSLSNIDAGIALSQLQRLEQHAAERRSHAESMMQRLQTLPGEMITDLSPSGMAVKLIYILPEERSVGRRGDSYFVQVWH